MIKNEFAALKKVNFLNFYYFWYYDHGQGVFGHDLTPIKGFCPRATF